VNRHDQPEDLRVETQLFPTPNKRVLKPAPAANWILIMQISECLSPIHQAQDDVAGSLCSPWQSFGALPKPWCHIGRGTKILKTHKP
jgi:hypothetical protein